MYPKEIDLTKTIKYACSTVFDQLYYFEDETDEYAEGSIYHSGDNEDVKEIFDLDDSINNLVDITKAVIDSGKTVFCLLGSICDNSDFGEEGFSIESSNLNKDYDVESSQTILKTGGFGVYINKCDGKYFCEYGLYSMQPTYPHGPADETFKHMSPRYRKDIIGKDIINALDSLDIYIEDFEIPTVDEIKKIIKNTKHAGIDVEETILMTINSGWMEENYFVSLTDGSYIFDVMEMEDLEYDFLSDEYFDFVNKQLEEDGIYIALGYACPECGGDANNDEEEGTGVCTWEDSVELSLPRDSLLGDMTTDYGIQVIKTENGYEITFSFNDSITFGHAMGYRKISSIEDNLEEPLHRVLIKLMNEAIIFKE